MTENEIAKIVVDAAFGIHKDGIIRVANGLPEDEWSFDLFVPWRLCGFAPNIHPFTRYPCCSLGQAYHDAYRQFLSEPLMEAPTGQSSETGK